MNEFLLMTTSLVILFFIDGKVISGQLITEFLVNEKQLLVTKSHSIDLFMSLNSFYLHL